MGKFLNTSATNYYLEELIKAARERRIIISPFLNFNDRIRELLEDKDRMKIDVRIVYGKSPLCQPSCRRTRSTGCAPWTSCAPALASTPTPGATSPSATPSSRP